MKKPQIAILHSTDNLAGLGPILTRMGFLSEFYSGIRALRAAMQKSVPDLLLVDAKLADKSLGFEGTDTICGEFSNLCPLLFAEKDEKTFKFSDRQDTQIPSLYDFHNYVLESLNDYSRKNLRLEVNLPSLLNRENASQLTKVTSLSSGGAFVRTGYSTPEQGQVIEMTITLLGHSTELDVRGRVLYRVDPCQENNYVQGVGVCFEQPRSLINRYLFSSLSGDLTADFVAGEQKDSRPLRPTTKKQNRIGIINKAC